MPSPTPKQKVEQVKMFGGDYVDIQLTGDTFDDAYKLAKHVCDTLGKTFIHPFDDKKIIEGQATVGLEIIKQSKGTHRLCFCSCWRRRISFRFIECF